MDSWMGEQGTVSQCQQIAYKRAAGGTPKFQGVFGQVAVGQMSQLLDEVRKHLDPCPGLRLTPPKPRGWDAQLSIGNISPDHGSRASLPAIADGSPSPSEAVSPSGSVSVEMEHRLTGCTASRRNSDES